MKYRESEEMYLETILVLKKEKPNVHSIDVANDLGYTRPSVSRGVNLLQKKGYIVIDKNGEINFTDEGRKKATAIYERHHIITDVLVKIGADKTVAEENACRIEHVISDELLETLKKYLET